MSLDMKNLKIDADNGSFSFNVVDQEARNLAQQALDAAGSGSVTYAKEVELLAANWQTEKEGRYYQTFDIPKANANSKMDVGLSETALEIMQDKVLTITATFRDGVTRVYAIGDKPTQDFVVHISFEDVVWL